MAEPEVKKTRVRFVPVDRDGIPMSKQEQARINRDQEEGDRQRAAERAAELKRHDLIARFERQQLVARDWISFAEIIDWRSRQDANGIPSKENEKVAINDLRREVAAGVIFYTEDRSHILLTIIDDNDLTDALLANPRALPPTAWITRERWLTWAEIHSEDTLDRLLRSCWVPRALCLKFAANVPFQPNLDWIRDDQPQGFAETLPLRKHLTVTAATLLRRRRGPNPAVTTAAKEKLRHMLRTGEIKPFQLENSIEDGGLKQESLASMLGVGSRSTAKSVIISVLAEEEFFKPRQTPPIAK